MGRVYTIIEMVAGNDHRYLSKIYLIRRHLGTRNTEFSSAVIAVVFGISFAS